MLKETGKFGYIWVFGKHLWISLFSPATDHLVCCIRVGADWEGSELGTRPDHWWRTSENRPTLGTLEGVQSNKQRRVSKGKEIVKE